MTAEAAAPRRHDLRLVPAAIAGWAATLAGLRLGWGAATAIGAAAVVVSLVFLVRGRGRYVGAGGALLLVGLAAALPTALRIHQADADPLAAAAVHGATAALRIEISERPRPIRQSGYADQQAGARSVAIPAHVRAATVDSRQVDSAGRVVLLAPVTGWSTLLPGQEVTATGRLMPARGGELTAAVLSVRAAPRDVGAAPWWQRAAATLRNSLHSLCAVLPEEPAGLVPGLVLGDTSALPHQVENEFVASGLTHLMAVSGGNLVVVGGAVLLLCRALRAGPRLSAVAAGLSLASFLILVGPEPSVVRAGVMGGIGLLALALGRRGSALPALAFAVCVLVAWDPAMAANFGFALSVLATAGLVLLAPRWAESLTRKGVPPGYAEGLAVPLAAFVVTVPVIAGMAGTVSLVSVVTNVLAAPVVAPVTVLGVLATAAGPWWPGAGHLLVRLAEPEAQWLILVARHGARAPGAVLTWPGGWWGGLCAAGLLAVVVVALRFRRIRLLIALGLVVVLLTVVPVKVLKPGWPPEGWAMVECDVGQGDAVVLATSEPGRAVVIDTGPEPGPVDECLRRLGVERVPLLVLSHLHADHIGGLESVFDGRAIGAIAIGPGRAPAWAWQQVSGAAKTRGVPLVQLSAGQRLAWPGLSLDVLGPRYATSRAPALQDGTMINNSSVVLRADTSAGRILLTGDVELAAQADLLAEGVDVQADVLKVPHHGSRYSLPQFLAAVRPRTALISVGAGNGYGHPSKSTMDVLRVMGVLVTRTDLDGDTAVLPSGGGPAVARRGEPRGPPR
ncbi:ComEC/Rec2 family competence protein [Amycolatopsis benzoatilytica]|uniref:ComEC/Rec2 family competence protein n=1 Tax=Amycolatopsis benzoatilytica TaxID=346045 RepID=UPI00037B38C3|nr:ComEC/Rec2 family competence protein [Amycolatopsis benzoatilytica]